jgi:hypothetical protein
MPHDKQSVPAAMAFPNDGTNRVTDVDLVGCCGLIVGAAPTADATLVIISDGETCSFTLYAPGTAGEGPTEFPWRLDMQIDQIVGGTGGTDVDLDTITLLKGRC